MRKIEKDKKDKRNSIYSFITMVTILCIGILMVGNIIVVAKSVKLADNITILERDIKMLKIENAELKRELAEVNSMENLEEYAEQLGFTKEAEPLYLETSDYALLR